MTSDTLPESIQLYEPEVAEGWVDPNLDLPYIDALASDLAGVLQTGVAECVYQPGDGTRYPLVIVPLFMLRHGRPRAFEGLGYTELHAVSGMKAAGGRDDDDGDSFYDPHGYLVAWVDHQCYPIRLGGGRGTLAGSYVAEHWGAGAMSGVALALLLRAVSWHLDVWASGVASTPSRAT